MYTALMPISDRDICFCISDHLTYFRTFDMFVHTDFRSRRRCTPCTRPSSNRQCAQRRSRFTTRSTRSGVVSLRMCVLPMCTANLNCQCVMELHCRVVLPMCPTSGLCRHTSFRCVLVIRTFKEYFRCVLSRFTLRCTFEVYFWCDQRSHARRHAQTQV